MHYAQVISQSGKQLVTRILKSFFISPNSFSIGHKHFLWTGELRRIVYLKPMHNLPPNTRSLFSWWDVPRGFNSLYKNFQSMEGS